jgi:hypothetical protein
MAVIGDQHEQINAPSRTVRAHVHRTAAIFNSQPDGADCRICRAQQPRDIVKTYIDEGKTGLKIQGRKGLQQLLATVTANQAPYGVILVYDISRSGRF